MTDAEGTWYEHKPRVWRRRLGPLLATVAPEGWPGPDRPDWRPSTWVLVVDIVRRGTRREVARARRPLLRDVKDIAEGVMERLAGQLGVRKVRPRKANGRGLEAAVVRERVKGAPGWHRGARQRGAWRHVQAKPDVALEGRVGVADGQGWWRVQRISTGKVVASGVFSGTLAEGCGAADEAIASEVLRAKRAARDLKSQRKAQTMGATPS